MAQRFFPRSSKCRALTEPIIGSTAPQSKEECQPKLRNPCLCLPLSALAGICFCSDPIFLFFPSSNGRPLVDIHKLTRSLSPVELDVPRALDPTLKATRAREWTKRWSKVTLCVVFCGSWKYCAAVRLKSAEPLRKRGCLSTWSKVVGQEGSAYMIGGILNCSRPAIKRPFSRKWILLISLAAGRIAAGKRRGKARRSSTARPNSQS